MRLPVSLQTENKYTPYQLYRMYLALKLHFTSQSYDIFKYNGKVSASEESFDTRKDKYKFMKLSKHKDPAGVLVANFVQNSKFWVGSIDDPESEKTYLAWLKTQESMTYNFSQEMKKLFDGKSLDAVLYVPEGQHPLLLSKHLRGEVSLESLTILQGIINFIPYWNESIVDPVLWADVRTLITKYSPFLEWNRSDFTKKLGEYVDLTS
jgi:hypothetical protein